MRKKFVLYVLIPMVILLTIVYLFIDRWVTAGLETAGEAAVGAKVEIQQLRVTLSPLGMEWQRLQVADPHDPWRNLFETGRVRFGLNFGQLLRNKYIVESMEVNDLIVGTKRTTDGSLPARTPAAEQSSQGSSPFSDLAKDALQRTRAETPALNLEHLKGGLNADSLVKTLDIRTLRYIDSLKTQVTSASKQWDGTLADVEASKAKLNDISVSVKAINPAELKSPEKILATISVVDRAVTDVNSINKTFTDRKASVEGDLRKLGASAAGIDDVAKGDFQHLLSLARLPDLNTGGIARLLIGREMYDKGTRYLYWVDRARQYVKKYSPQPKPEQPPRMRGQDIHFPVERAYPTFWIKKVLVSGGTDSTQLTDYIHARGEIRNITNDQTVTGVPITVNLEGSQAGARAMSLGAILDRTKDIPFDEYKASLSNVPLSEFELGNAGFLPSKITQARVNSTVTISIPGNQFDSRTHMEFGNITIVFEADPRNTFERLVREVLQGMKAFDVDLRLWNTGGSFDVALATNLDDQIAGRLKDVLGAEFTKVQNELRAKLDATINEKRKVFETMYAEKKGEVEKRLASVQSLVNDNLSMLDGKKKELTDRLEKEKKGKVDDVLKKILK